MKYYSQEPCNQDKHVDNFFNKKENGYFVDIGCSHYSEGSNTYFFEKNRNWKGICIDLFDYSEMYKEHRPNSIFINGAVTNFNTNDVKYVDILEANVLSSVESLTCERHKKRFEKENCNVIKRSVPNLNFNNILIENKAPMNIDYISIDTEGSELEIIKSIDFSKWNIKIFTIEFNGKEYWNRTEMDNIMKNQGYKKTNYGWDFVYYK